MTYGKTLHGVPYIAMVKKGLINSTVLVPLKTYIEEFAGDAK